MRSAGTWNSPSSFSCPQSRQATTSDDRDAVNSWDPQEFPSQTQPLEIWSPRSDSVAVGLGPYATSAFTVNESYGRIHHPGLPSSITTSRKLRVRSFFVLFEWVKDNQFVTCLCLQSHFKTSAIGNMFETTYQFYVLHPYVFIFSDSD